MASAPSRAHQSRRNVPTRRAASEKRRTSSSESSTSNTLYRAVIWTHAYDSAGLLRQASMMAFGRKAFKGNHRNVGGYNMVLITYVRLRHLKRRDGGSEFRG